MIFFRYILLLTIIVISTTAHAQIVDFSQVYNNYVYLNPAFVGTALSPRAFTSYRIKNLYGESYNSAYVSFDVDLREGYGSVGGSILQDNQDGTWSETQLMALYAKTFQVRKKLFLNASLAAGYNYGTTNYSGLIFSDMLNIFQNDIGQTKEDLERTSRHNFNSEFGLLLYNDIFYTGMSIKNLQGNLGDENKSLNLFPRTFSFHGMAKFSTTKAFMLRYLIWLYPHINIVIGETSSYGQVGLILQKWFVQLGGAFRQNFPCNENSFSIFIGVVEKKFRFAYNCDMTINSVNRYGTHEVSLSYQFDNRKKKKKFEAVKAPTF